MTTVDSRVRTVVRRALAVLTMVTGLLLLGTTSASAHAELVETNPANGAHLDRAPREIMLRFSETVSPVRGGFTLLDGNGRTVATPAGASAAGDGGRIRMPVPDSLGDGVYVLNWRVLSADSHPIHGAFVFSVGTARAAPLADAGALAGSDSAVAFAFWLFRLFGYASLALLIGGSFFIIACWPAGRTDRRANRMIKTAWLASVVCAVLALLLQGPYVAGTGLAGLFDPALVADTAGTTYGVLVLIRIALLAVAGYVMIRLVRAAEPLSGRSGGGGRGVGWTEEQRRRASAEQRTEEANTFGGWSRSDHRTQHIAAFAILGSALALTWSGTGHPAAAGDLAWAALLLDAGHLGAVAVWLGGLAVLAGATLGRHSRAAEDEAAAAVSRYSTTAAIAVAVLGATGLLQAWRELAASGVGTEYFSLLVFKVGAFGLLIWLAALSRSAVRRRLAMPADARRRAAKRAQRDMLTGLRQSVRWEAVIAAVVLALTASLVATPPGGHDHGPAAAATLPEGPFLEALALPDAGDVQVWMDPARTGTNQLVLNVRDDRGINRDIPEVQAQLRLPANNIGPLPVTLARTGPGQFVANGVVVPVAGTWQLNVRVRSTDFDESSVDAQVTVR